MTTTLPGTRLPAASLIERAEGLVPLLRRDAPAMEDAKRLTPEVHKAFIEAGFYRMTMPPEYAPADLTLAETMRVLEALARGDGSAAWSAWSALGAGAMSAFITEEGARELFAAPEACVVGSMAAMGRAVPVQGGYRVSGRWPFASGIHQATFAAGFCLVVDGDQPVMTERGPVVVVPAWPVGECAIIDNWDTTGLRGSGSDDIAVEDLFVPAYRTIDFSKPPRPGLGRVQYLHVDNAANMTIAAMAVGIAESALEAFRSLAPARKLANGEILADSALGKLTLAAAETTLAAARGHLYEVADLLMDDILAGAYQDEAWFARTSLASVAAVDAAIEVTLRLYREAGTAAIRRSNRIDRCLRDLLSLGAHKTVQHVNLLVHGGKTA